KPTGPAASRTAVGTLWLPVRRIALIVELAFPLGVAGLDECNGRGFQFAHAFALFDSRPGPDVELGRRDDIEVSAVGSAVRSIKRSERDVRRRSRLSRIPRHFGCDKVACARRGQDPLRQWTLGGNKRRDSDMLRWRR